MTRVCLDFVTHKGTQRLQEVLFQHPTCATKHVARLGQYSEFVWRQGTIAVVAFLVGAAQNAAHRAGRYSIEGRRPSIAATINDVLTRRGQGRLLAWVSDILGADAKTGEPLLWKCFNVQNQDFRCKTSPVVICLNEAFLPAELIQIRVDGRVVDDRKGLESLCNSLINQWNQSRLPNSRKDGEFAASKSQSSTFSFEADIRHLEIMPLHPQCENTLALSARLRRVLTVHKLEHCDVLNVTFATRNGCVLDASCKLFPFTITEQVRPDSTRSQELRLRHMSIDVSSISSGELFAVELDACYFGDFHNDGDRWLGICGPACSSKKLIVDFPPDQNLDRLRLLEVRSKDKARSVDSQPVILRNQGKTRLVSSLPPDGERDFRLCWE